MQKHPILETARDIAARYGVTSRTVLKWAAEGTIPVAVKVGAVVRFDPQAVADALGELARRAVDRKGGADE